MIHIVLGSKISVGTEVLLKSLPYIQNDMLKKVVIHSDIKSFQDYSKELNIGTISPAFKHLNFNYQTEPFNPIKVLENIIPNLKHNDYLITLPATKKDLSGYSGYTDFFRKKFHTDGISMLFVSKDENIMLLTDHIPLNKVSEKIVKTIIISNVSSSISGLQKIKRFIKEVNIFGVNPHSGEGGLIGPEEIDIFKPAIETLQNQWPLIKFNLMESTDGVQLKPSKKNSNILDVYSYHDQALPLYKYKNSYLNFNYTVGLPFVRVSTCHGTAPNMYRKNAADISSMLFIFRNLLNLP